MEIMWKGSTVGLLPLTVQLVIPWRTESWIAPGIRGRGPTKRGGTRRRIELRPAVKGLVLIPIVGPVLPERPEVMVKTAIFPGENDDVLIFVMSFRRAESWC
jgi:hypothetical protein